MNYCTSTASTAAAKLLLSFPFALMETIIRLDALDISSDRRIFSTVCVYCNVRWLRVHL